MKRLVFALLLDTLLLPPSALAQPTHEVGEPVGLELTDGATLELTVEIVEFHAECMLGIAQIEKWSHQ